MIIELGRVTRETKTLAAGYAFDNVGKTTFIADLCPAVKFPKLRQCVTSGPTVDGHATSCPGGFVSSATLCQAP